MKLRIVPSFWLLAAFLAFSQTRDPIYMIQWVGAIFISLMVHELGHALSLRLFQRRAHIELSFIGGSTASYGTPLPFLKQALVVGAGPLFGFTLVFLMSFLLSFETLAPFFPLMQMIFVTSLFWNVLNSMPLIPLDGGKLLGLLLERFFDTKGLRLSYMLSALFAFVLASIFFVFHQLFAGSLFLLFTFENFQNFRNSKYLVSSKVEKRYVNELDEADLLWSKGKEEEAMHKLERVVASSQEKKLFYPASEKLAHFYVRSEQPHKAFMQLSSIKAHLSYEGLKLLQLAAFKEAFYDEALWAGKRAFKHIQEVDVVVFNALIAAALKNMEEVLHWLQYTKEHFTVDIKQLVSQKAFDFCREDSRFVFLRDV